MLVVYTDRLLIVTELILPLSEGIVITFVNPFVSDTLCDVSKSTSPIFYVEHLC